MSALSTCPYCGWPDEKPVQTLSRHRVGEGVTVWTRCACGSLQARQLTVGSVVITLRGPPTGSGPHDS
ncbi:hypothetical protein [Streptomyces sp. NPDC059063]|uniref:hypothetical protein n=1 Tax=unclassified Streptomyces TaxID=2593676 RepID=UPI003674CB16